ncbi:MarR family winged helix-turn-helix transcriptional regulator [Fodinicola feengrottensis]|uniref:HTH marR-type domain-containing protein n=1 Tax=Fodinicola feengrottensis TaxID=435914 RepID=A0ABP4TN37_9ACTN|nr:MarR family transcriptional regulator [Fodinicola feengrottensis]
MSNQARREALVTELVAALPGWQVPLAQLNGLIADRMGVTTSDLQCLYALAHDGPATASVLAKRVNLTSGSASRMVDRLEAAGYLRRVPDPTDRRRILIEPDQDSINRVGAYYDPLNQRHRDDLGDFDEEQLSLLLRFVKAAEASTESVVREFSRTSE